MNRLMLAWTLITIPVLRFVRWLGRPAEELLDPFGDDQGDQW